MRAEPVRLTDDKQRRASAANGERAHMLRNKVAMMTMIRSKIAPLRRSLATVATPAILAALGCALASPAFAESESGWGLLNMTEGVTAISKEIYDLHMRIFEICVAIAIVVFGVMIWSIVRFRKSKGAVADTTLVHSTRVEVVWTAIPVVILVVMAVPAARTLVKIEDTTNTQLSIKITGF